MADEVNQTDFLAGLNFTLDDDSGQLNVVTEEKQDQTGNESSENLLNTTIQQSETKKEVEIPEYVTALQNDNVRLTGEIGTLKNALVLLIQTLQNNYSQNQEDDLPEDSRRIVDKVSSVVDQKLQALNPVIQQNQLIQEVQQVASKYNDLREYWAGMQYLSNHFPGSFNSVEELYLKSKQMNLRSNLPQQPHQQNNNNNVTNIDEKKRNLPPRINSTNTELENKEVNSVRDAFGLALKELGVG